jgi:histone acetyltransferase (RNA polymerase elongator complex component)
MKTKMKNRLTPTQLNQIKGGDTTVMTEAERLAKEEAARIAKVSGKSITI